MNFLKSFFFIFLIGLSFPIGAQTNLSFAQAKVKAQKEGKYIYVFYTAEWCLPCKMMKEGAFSDQRINHILAKGVVAIEVDQDDPSTKSWFDRFNVTAIPMSMILDKDGNVYRKLEGFKSVESVYQMLSEFSTVDPNQAQLTQTTSVFNKASKRNKLSTSLVTIANNKRKIKEQQISTTTTTNSYTTSSPHSVAGTSSSPTHHSEKAKPEIFRPSLYAIQLRSFNNVSDALEYLDYLNDKIEGGAQIFTNDEKSFFNVVVEYPTLNNAKANYSIFKSIEANCFIRIL